MLSIVFVFAQDKVLIKKIIKHLYKDIQRDIEVEHPYYVSQGYPLKEFTYQGIPDMPHIWPLNTTEPVWLCIKR